MPSTAIASIASGDLLRLYYRDMRAVACLDELQRLRVVQLVKSVQAGIRYERGCLLHGATWECRDG
jgi:hypothetical protein